jgi:hypothetical protein
VVEVEIDNQKSEKDISSVAKQMIEQAKAEAMNKVNYDERDYLSASQDGAQGL